MEQDTTSFWIDIKKYEDILAKDPNSYCFAPLAELYRKLGLLDDAIVIAERGCKLHPEFVSGCMALGRAYLDKGLKEESRLLLEKVVRATPENLMAQKLLSQLYIESGEIAAAEKALQIILALDPDDVESRVILESLTVVAKGLSRPDGGGAAEPSTMVNAEEVPEVGEEDEFILEEVELVEELTEEDIVEEGPSWEGGEPETPSEIVSVDAAAVPQRDGRDPLTTGTLAELYVSQGFVEKAIGIYRELQESDPDNSEIRLRLEQLESTQKLAEASSASAAAGEAVVPESDSSCEPDSALETPSAQGATARGALETLEGWLENIRRRRHVI